MSDTQPLVSPSTETGATEPAATPPPVQDPEQETGGTVETPPATTPDIATPDSAPSRAQARIEELAAEKQAARDAAEYWRQRALAQAETPAPTVEKHAPKFAEFESADDWAAAHAAFVEERADARAQKAAETRYQTERAQATAEATRTAFEAREEAFSKTVKGYKETVSNPMLTRYVTPTLVDIIQTSELGPALSFHLATNTDKLARITRLPPAQQAAALGRLESELASKPAPAPPKASTRAPAPPTPVGNAPPSKSIEDMSIDEFMAHRSQGRKVIS